MCKLSDSSCQPVSSDEVQEAGPVASDSGVQPESSGVVVAEGKVWALPACPEASSVVLSLPDRADAVAGEWPAAAALHLQFALPAGRAEEDREGHGLLLAL